MSSPSSGRDPFGMVGQVLDGQFRVDRVVGEGGFSVVFKGHHLGLDEPIAIECLKLPMALGSAFVESFIRRFRDESRLHYRLSQGNLYIARSIASGTTMAPITSALVPYMVLEWLEGCSLAQEFMRRQSEGLNGRPLSEIVKVLDPALDAIAYAHAQGVVHRDLNPGNLFLARTREGTKLKVLDFGVAKVVSDHALDMGPRAQTIGHIRIFSPAYGSPEQFDDKVGKVGPWSDVYALSLIILEALRDRTVNEGEHLGEFAMAALDEEKRPTPRSLGVAVGDEVEALMASALSLDPAARPQDAGEFWGMMKNAIRRDGESGMPPHAHRPQSMPPRTSSINDTNAVPASTPAVEVRRPRSASPPQLVELEPVPHTVRIPRTVGTSDAPPEGPRPDAGRPLASTVRMSNAPQRPGESTPPPGVSAMLGGGASTLPLSYSGARALSATPGTIVSAPSAPPPPILTPVPPRMEGSSASVAPLQASPYGAWSQPPPPAFAGAREPELSSPQAALPSAYQASSLESESADVPKSRAPLAIVLVLLAVAVVGGAVMIYAWTQRAGGTSSVPVTPATSTATAPVPSLDLSGMATSETSSGAPSDPPPSSPAQQPTPTPTAGPTVLPNGFDSSAAESSLTDVDGILASCKRAGGHTGAGSVTVTFANDGSVTSAAVAPPFAGTPEGACVESRFRTARVSPFVGATGRVVHAFRVPS